MDLPATLSPPFERNFVFAIEKLTTILENIEFLSKEITFQSKAKDYNNTTKYSFRIKVNFDDESSRKPDHSEFVSLFQVILPELGTGNFFRADITPISIQHDSNARKTVRIQAKIDPLGELEPTFDVVFNDPRNSNEGYSPEWDSLMQSQKEILVEACKRSLTKPLQEIVLYMSKKQDALPFE